MTSKQVGHQRRRNLVYSTLSIVAVKSPIKHPTRPPVPQTAQAHRTKAPTVRVVKSKTTNDRTAGLVVAARKAEVMAPALAPDDLSLQAEFVSGEATVPSITVTAPQEAEEPDIFEADQPQGVASLAWSVAPTQEDFGQVPAKTSQLSDTEDNAIASDTGSLSLTQSSESKDDESFANASEALSIPPDVPEPGRPVSLHGVVAEWAEWAETSQSSDTEVDALASDTESVTLTQFPDLVSEVKGEEPPGVLAGPPMLLEPTRLLSLPDEELTPLIDSFVKVCNP